ncbi:hypothetical protein [Sphingomonas hengshuiensis]|uniref:hypothetical protein n=1 Tax=Sphingomonas hengshuiensis TaxID=1609977 RepID=UPI000A92BC1E|nr:hypothetical protein [Sphingomonas hengshuiensis]
MDQLDVNLSELRIALVEKRRARASRITPVARMGDDGGNHDASMISEVSCDQSPPRSIEPEQARSWFQRLFGA